MDCGRCRPLYTGQWLRTRLRCAMRQARSRASFRKWQIDAARSRDRANLGVSMTCGPNPFQRRSLSSSTATSVRRPRCRPGRPPSSPLQVSPCSAVSSRTPCISTTNAGTTQSSAKNSVCQRSAVQFHHTTNRHLCRQGEEESSDGAVGAGSSTGCQAGRHPCRAAEDQGRTVAPKPRGEGDILHVER